MSNLMFRLATVFMDSSLDTDAGVAEDAINKAYSAFKSVTGYVIPIVISVVLLLGMFFGISLGIKFAKAEDTDARDKAKGQLINLAIGVGVAAVILIVCNILIQTDVLSGLFGNY